MRIPEVVVFEITQSIITECSAVGPRLSCRLSSSVPRTMLCSYKVSEFAGSLQCCKCMQLVITCGVILVKLRSLATSKPNVAVMSLEVCRALKLTSVLAAFGNIRFRPNSMMVITFPGSCTSPRCPTQPKFSAVAYDCLVPVDIRCLSAASKLHAEAWLECCKQASC